MVTNQKGLDLIKEFEGFMAKAYKCPAGVYTIGYGHTAGVKEGDVITKERANDLLQNDVAWAEKSVERMVKMPLGGNQFAALVSLVYNIGSGNFQKSRVLQFLNKFQATDACSAFADHVFAGGKKLKGLVRRREAEQKLFKASV